MTIAKVVRIVKLGEEKPDSAYWLTRPLQERLAAVEEIRREYHLWRYGAEPRLQRVFRIVPISLSK
jgi:serine/threonine protein kinase HipA of HipAB toxin-antitoxin module